jgi:hypothetical protein
MQESILQLTPLKATLKRKWQKLAHQKATGSLITKYTKKNAVKKLTAFFILLK